MRTTLIQPHQVKCGSRLSAMPYYTCMGEISLFAGHLGCSFTHSVAGSEIAEVRWTGGEGTGSAVSLLNVMYIYKAKVCSETGQHSTVGLCTFSTTHCVRLISKAGNRLITGLIGLSQTSGPLALYLDILVC